MHAVTGIADKTATLATAYGLGRVLSCVQLGGTRNNNFRVDTPTGAWLVRRRYDAYASPQQIQFDHSVATHLQLSGAAVFAPRALPNGDTFWNDGSDTWEVQPFIEGAQFREGNAGDVIALAEELAQFHAAGESFSGRLQKLAPRGETDPAQMRLASCELAGASPECAKAVAPYREWLDWAESALPDDRFAQLPSTIVHGDIQPANILMHDGRVAAFVDLDWCAWRPRIYDLAFALLFCCAAHEHPIDGGDIWSLTQPPRVSREAWRRFLDAYEAHACLLTRDEQKALPVQVLLSWCHTRIMGAFKVPAEGRAAFLARPPSDKTELLIGITA